MTTAVAPPLSDRDLLASEIAASGLTARQFAVRVLFRDDRSVRRWLRGQPIKSKEIRAQLLRWHNGQDPRPYQVIAVLVERDAPWGPRRRQGTALPADD